MPGPVAVIGSMRAFGTFRTRAARGAARLFGARRLRVHARNAQLGAADFDLLQLAEDFLRHAFRQVDEAVVFADVDVADEFAIEPGLVGDGADDVAGEHALGVADFDAEGFHLRAVAFGATFAPLARRAIVAGSDAVIGVDWRTLLGGLAAAIDRRLLLEGLIAAAFSRTARALTAITAF